MFFRKQVVPQARPERAPNVLSRINRINENILILRHELRTLHHDVEKYTPNIFYDQDEEIARALHDLKVKAELYDPLEEYCQDDPSAFECRIYE